MKKLTIAVIVLIAFGGGILFFTDLPSISRVLSERLSQIEESIRGIDVEGLKQAEVIAPGPLRGPLQPQPSKLTEIGIIEWTNNQRIENGLPPLALNGKLKLSAQLKAQDMLEEQYFAHISPSGEGVGDLAGSITYQYIAIGENLAMGNYRNDEALVRAWMDSPGHRANILNSRYEEIGIGLARGTFEGAGVWMAVQHFGMPLSACPQPSAALLQQIEQNNEQLEIWRAELEARRQDLEEHEPKFGPAYNRKVREYNALVEQYNLLLEETKILVSQYNHQVNEFNICAAGSS